MDDLIRTSDTSDGDVLPLEENRRKRVEVKQCAVHRIDGGGREAGDRGFVGPL
jgi:hypothetical protein